MVPLARVALGQRIAPGGFERCLTTSLAGLGQPVLGSPPEVEGSEHGNVDTQPCKHELDAAEHEGRDRCSGQVANEVDDEDLPEADDADYDAAAIVRWY